MPKLQQFLPAAIDIAPLSHCNPSPVYLLVCASQTRQRPAGGATGELPSRMCQAPRCLDQSQGKFGFGLCQKKPCLPQLVGFTWLHHVNLCWLRHVFSQCQITSHFRKHPPATHPRQAPHPRHDAIPISRLAAQGEDRLGMCGIDSVDGCDALDAQVSGKVTKQAHKSCYRIYLSTIRALLLRMVALGFRSPCPGHVLLCFENI